MCIQIDKSKKNFDEEIKTHMMNAALKNLKECKVDQIKTEKLRDSFMRTHYQYFPRKRRNMVVKNVMTERPENSARFDEGGFQPHLPDSELLSRNQLAELMAIEDHKQRMTKQVFPEPVMPPSSPYHDEFIR